MFKTKDTCVAEKKSAYQPERMAVFLLRFSDRRKKEKREFKRSWTILVQNFVFSMITNCCFQMNS